MSVTTFLVAGSTTWTVPAGVTSVTVEAWGGGGGGGSRTTNGVAGGGGGGAYGSSVATVVPGTIEVLRVGASGASVTNGGYTSFADPMSLDTTSNSGAAVLASSSFSWSHTCTGTNVALFVFVSNFNATSQMLVSGITYNGVALTKLRGDTRASLSPSAGNYSDEIWYLGTPATGSNTIAVTMTGATTEVAAGAASFVNGFSTQADAVNGTFGTNNAPTVSVTTVSESCLPVSAICYNSGFGTHISVNVGTQIYKTTGTLIDAAASYGAAKTPPGSATLSWTAGGGGSDWSESIASLTPYIWARGDFGLGGTANVATGAAGGTTANSIGTTTHKGGTGGTGSGSSAGGGGGAGGSANDGGNGGVPTAGTGGAVGGGNGGAGQTGQGAGGPGIQPGGGGGGARRTSAGTQAGGAGAIGEVQLTYTVASSGGAPTFMTMGIGQ